MKLEQYRLSGGLTPEQIGLMKRKAIELVERVGLHVPHQGILDLLRQHDGVKVEGETVKFRPELVEKALAAARFPLPEYYGKEWVISAGAHQPKMHDLETGALRDTTLQDLKDLVKIGDALDTVGSAPCVPLDVPIHLQEIQMHKVAWENSRRRANDMFEHDPKPNVNVAQYVYEMSQAAGRWFSLGLYMVSPRTFDPPELEIIYRFLDKGVPMWAGTMPITGVNAPILEKAGILQAMFETLACLTMLSLINTKGYNYIQVIDSFIVHPFDMKYSTFVYGSAEDARGTMDKLAIHKELGLPLVAKSLITGAKQVDAQSAHEVGVYTMMAAPWPAAAPSAARACCPAPSCTPPRSWWWTTRSCSTSARPWSRRSSARRPCWPRRSRPSSPGRASWSTPAPSSSTRATTGIPPCSPTPTWGSGRRWAPRACTGTPTSGPRSC